MAQSKPGFFFNFFDLSGLNVGRFDENRLREIFADYKLFAATSNGHIVKSNDLVSAHFLPESGKGMEGELKQFGRWPPKPTMLESGIVFYSDRCIQIEHVLRDDDNKDIGSTVYHGFVNERTYRYMKRSVENLLNEHDAILNPDVVGTLVYAKKLVVPVTDEVYYLITRLVDLKKHPLAQAVRDWKEVERISEPFVLVFNRDKNVKVDHDWQAIHDLVNDPERRQTFLVPFSLLDARVPVFNKKMEPRQAVEVLLVDEKKKEVPPESHMDSKHSNPPLAAATAAGDETEEDEEPSPPVDVVPREQAKEKVADEKKQEQSAVLQEAEGAKAVAAIPNQGAVFAAASDFGIVAALAPAPVVAPGDSKDVKEKAAPAPAPAPVYPSSVATEEEDGEQEEEEKATVQKKKKKSKGFTSAYKKTKNVKRGKNTKRKHEEEQAEVAPNKRARRTGKAKTR